MEQRVVTKLIVVVQVFIAEREGEHALADQGLDRVLEQSWVAPVGETAGHPTDQPEAAIQPPQQQPSGIRCDDSAIEPGHNLVPFNRFKFEQCWATLCLHRGLSGIAVSDWRIAIFRDSPPRCIKGFEKSGLAGWELPDAFPTLRRLLEARMGKAGKREYVQVLRLVETFDLEVLHGAVKDALRLGAIGYDAVKHLVLCRIERRPPKLDLDIYPYLPRANVATTAAASYMSLLGGGAS